jgi:hypothetical protein
VVQRRFLLHGWRFFGSVKGIIWDLEKLIYILEVAKDLGKLGAVCMDAGDLETAEKYSLKALKTFQTYIPTFI